MFTCIGDARNVAFCPSQTCCVYGFSSWLFFAASLHIVRAPTSRDAVSQCSHLLRHCTRVQICRCWAMLLFSLCQLSPNCILHEQHQSAIHLLKVHIVGCPFKFSGNLSFATLAVRACDLTPTNKTPTNNQTDQRCPSSKHLLQLSAHSPSHSCGPNAIVLGKTLIQCEQVRHSPQQVKLFCTSRSPWQLQLPMQLYFAWPVGENSAKVVALSSYAKSEKGVGGIHYTGGWA